MPTARKENVATAPTDPWVSIPTAARMLGCANATVLARALRGELRAQTVAGRTVVSRESISAALGETAQ